MIKKKLYSIILITNQNIGYKIMSLFLCAMLYQIDQKPSSDYVKQYEKIPKEGVLAQSDKK